MDARSKMTPDLFKDWKLFLNESGFAIENRNGSRVIVQRSGLSNPADTEALAHAIAAVPDLIGSLEWALAFIAHMTKEDFGDYDAGLQKAAYIKARAALSKALGSERT